MTTSSGRWGESEAAMVDVAGAINEFEELRQELSRTSAHHHHHPRPHNDDDTAAGSKAGSSIAKSIDSDPETAGQSADPSFVDLNDYISSTESGPKTLGISFRDLSVVGYAGAGFLVLPTFPYELASLFGYDIYKYARSLFASKPEARPIIQGFSGVVRPGEMLLVLAKPGSGASTFLRALTNQPRQMTEIKGEVNYAGIPFELAKGEYRGEVLYNDEEDEHMPTLLVGQTVDFALKSKTPGSGTRTPGRSRKEFVNKLKGTFLEMFKMKHVEKTIVGNAFIRGVSGGERKRVSIMEALASRSSINAWDNSTRGLDSSTAVDYIRSLRILTDVAKSTTIVTLYQAGEQIYREFDKVCLIYDGRQIFFGKASEARAYFEELGFEAAPRITTSDFLTTITEPKTRRIRPGMEDKVPLTPEALEQRFKTSRFFEEIQRELRDYDQELASRNGADAVAFKAAVRAEKSSSAPKKSPYVVGFFSQVWYLCMRELQLQVQDTTAWRSKLINIIVLGLVAGSLFYNIQPTSDGVFYMGGALFFNVIIVAWMQMIEAINMVMGRGIIQKQVNFAFYRPSALILARTFSDLPGTIIQSTLFTVILYWMANLAHDAGKFFINLLFVFMTVTCLTAFYRIVGVFSKDINVAIRLAFMCLNIIAVFAGYMQPFGVMKSWVYKWIYWVNPLSYSLEAVMINQFHGLLLRCSASHLVPGIPGASIENQVCTLAGSTPKSATIDGTRYIASYGYKPEHLWRNFGILCAFTVGYIIIAMIGIEVVNHGGGGGSVKVVSKLPKKVADGLPTIEEKKTPSDESGQPGTQDHAMAELARRVTTNAPKNGSSFTWKDVCYTVGSGSNETKLLNNISGLVRPGTLTALMGPSGAGKTTLLDNLAQRKRVGVTTGEVLVDGKPLTADFGRNTAFVEQQDVHDQMSTVREALRFSAMLRQPATISKAEKYAFVEEIITLLELENLADCIIGSPGFGLSVEERKRVTIGVELASAPSELLFLDEPTSGLDANGALEIVRFLRKLADKSNIAILCTIHQPSAILIQEFDDLLLLARGGKQVYYGPIGKQGGQEVISYFERNGASPASDDVNPAEYVLDTIRSTPGGKTWDEIWLSSPERIATLEEIQHIKSTRGTIPTNRELRTLEYAMPLSTQILTVTHRVWLHYWRDASYGYSKVFSNLSMSLIGGVLFLQSGTSVLEMQSKSFAIFICLFLSPLVITGVQPKFLQFRTLYETRERNSKIYSSTAWLTAMAIVEIPYAILGTVFFFLPWYYMIGLPSDSSRAGYAFLLLVLFNIWVPHIAMWIAAACEDMNIVALVNPFIFVITQGMSGVLVTYNGLLKFYSSWLYWVNPLTWFVRGMMGNVMHDAKVVCTENELVTFEPPRNLSCGEFAGDWLLQAKGYIVDLQARDSCRYCGFKNGDEYLMGLNVDYETRWKSLGIFCVFIVSNLVLVYTVYWVFREARWGRMLSRFRKAKAE